MFNNREVAELWYIHMMEYYMSINNYKKQENTWGNTHDKGKCKNKIIKL